MGEEIVVSFGGLVASEATLVHRLVCRFTVFELGESPATRVRVFCRVLDHKLNVNRRPGDEGLETAKRFIVFLRLDVAPGQPGNNCSVRQGERFIPISFDCRLVA